MHCTVEDCREVHAELMSVRPHHKAGQSTFWSVLTLCTVQTSSYPPHHLLYSTFMQMLPYYVPSPKTLGWAALRKKCFRNLHQFPSEREVHKAAYMYEGLYSSAFDSFNSLYCSCSLNTACSCFRGQLSYTIYHQIKKINDNRKPTCLPNKCSNQIHNEAMLSWNPIWVAV